MGGGLAREKSSWRKQLCQTIAGKVRSTENAMCAGTKASRVEQNEHERKKTHTHTPAKEADENYLNGGTYCTSTTVQY